MNKIVLFICVLLIPAFVLADVPATQPVGESKPFEKDGLRVTVTLDKPTLAVNEPIKFTVQFKNVSDKPFQLSNADGYHFCEWLYRFMKEGPGGGWGEFGFAQAGLLKNSVVQLDAGKTLDVPVVIEGMDLGGVARVLTAGREGQLKPGKYLGAVKMDLRNNVENDPKPAVRYWSGQAITEPVEFEIADPANRVNEDDKPGR